MTIESIFLEGLKQGPVLILGNMHDRTHAATDDPLIERSPLIRLAILAVDLGADPDYLSFDFRPPASALAMRDYTAVIYGLQPDGPDMQRMLKSDAPAFGFHWCELNRMFFVDEFVAHRKVLKASRAKDGNEHVRDPIVWIEPQPAKLDRANPKHLRVVERIHVHFSNQGWHTAAERLQKCMEPQNPAQQPERVGVPQALDPDSVGPAAQTFVTVFHVAGEIDPAKLAEPITVRYPADSAVAEAVPASTREAKRGFAEHIIVTDGIRDAKARTAETPEAKTHTPEPDAKILMDQLLFSRHANLSFDEVQAIPPDQFARYHKALVDSLAHEYALVGRNIVRGEESEALRQRMDKSAREQWDRIILSLSISPLARYLPLRHTTAEFVEAALSRWSRWRSWASDRLGHLAREQVDRMNDEALMHAVADKIHKLRVSELDDRGPGRASRALATVAAFIQRYTGMGTAERARLSPGDLLDLADTVLKLDRQQAHEEMTGRIEALMKERDALRARAEKAETELQLIGMDDIGDALKRAKTAEDEAKIWHDRWQTHDNAITDITRAYFDGCMGPTPAKAGDIVAALRRYAEVNGQINTLAVELGLDPAKIDRQNRIPEIRMAIKARVDAAEARSTQITRAGAGHEIHIACIGALFGKEGPHAAHLISPANAAKVRIEKDQRLVYVVGRRPYLGEAPLGAGVLYTTDKVDDYGFEGERLVLVT